MSMFILYCIYLTVVDLSLFSAGISCERSSSSWDHRHGSCPHQRK